MKLGEAIKFAKPDLFELSEARKDLLCKRILDSSTETLTYFSDQIRAELQDRVMRDCDDEDDLIELWEDDLIDERRETVNERIAELERDKERNLRRIADLEGDKDSVAETLAGIESGETEVIYY